MKERVNPRLGSVAVARYSSVQVLNPIPTRIPEDVVDVLLDSMTEVWYQRNDDGRSQMLN